MVLNEVLIFFPSKFMDSVVSINGSQRKGKLGMLSKASLCTS